MGGWAKCLNSSKRPVYIRRVDDCTFSCLKARTPTRCRYSIQTYISLNLNVTTVSYERMELLGADVCCWSTEKDGEGEGTS